MISPEDIAAALAAAPGAGRVDLPTAEQSAVIGSAVEPLLVVAGAGSGKTTTMADRVVWLVVNGMARPEEILGLTFSRKAAAELGARIRSKLAAAAKAGLPIPAGGLDPSVSTYNSFAAAVVRDHALATGEDPDAQLLTDAGAFQMMQEICESWPVDLQIDGAITTVVTNALALSDGMSSHLLSIEEARRRLKMLAADIEQVRAGERGRGGARPCAVSEPADSVRTRLRLLDVVEAFRARKRELSLIEYADQVELACRIAARVPAAGISARTRYPIVLLDEFQDTSSAQLLFLRDLFGAGHPVMAVGDPNQAIYGWRGASASSLVDFRTHFAVAGTEVGLRHLTISWRNDHAILDAANTISAPLASAGGRAGALLKDLEARPGAKQGTVERQVTLTPEEEADGIADWIGRHWQPGKDTAAVLLRTKSQFAGVLRALGDRGLPAQVVGLTGLLSTPEVADLRAALQVAADASRSDAMMRLLTNYRLGLADLAVLSEWSLEQAGEHARAEADVSSSLVEAVEALPPAQFATRSGYQLSTFGRSRVQALGTALRRIRALLSLPLPEVVQAAERILGLDIEVAARAGVDPALARANLDAFAVHAASFEDGSLHPTLSGFLSWLDAAEAKENGLEMGVVESTTAAVQVLTLHAAKGLEWDSVAIAGLSEGRFPSLRGGTKANKGWTKRVEELPYPLRRDSEHLPRLLTDASQHKAYAAALEDFTVDNLNHGIAEERRLAYVGVTRAKSRLLLSTAHHPAGGTARALSRFLEELLDQAPIAPGLAHVEAPELGSPLEVEGTADLRRYPDYDPLPPARRARLDAAVAAVEKWRCGPVQNPGELGERLKALDVESAGTPAAELVADVRLLVAERESKQRLASVVLPGQLSATAAMALVTDPQQFAVDLRRPVPREPRPQARLGTEFHAWVEEHYGQPAFVFGGGEDLLFAEDDHRGGDHIADLREAFLASEWADRKPAAIELGLETTVAGRTVRCRIDAVFTGPAGIQVVDWKTGRRPSAAEWPTRQLQLSLYRLAYARASGTELADVRAAFHYVGSRATLWADQLTEAQIEDQVGRAVHALGEPGVVDSGSLRA